MATIHTIHVKKDDNLSMLLSDAAGTANIIEIVGPSNCEKGYTTLKFVEKAPQGFTTLDCHHSHSEDVVWSVASSLAHYPNAWVYIDNCDLMHARARNTLKALLKSSLTQDTKVFLVHNRMPFMGE